MDVSQINPHPIAGGQLCRGQPVADEKLIHDPLDLLGIQIDVVTPPFFEIKKTLDFRIDFGPEVVVLGPIGIRGIKVLEVFNEVSAIEGSVAKITAGLENFYVGDRAQNWHS